MASAVEGAALAGLGEDLEGEALMSRAYDILSNDAGALPVYVREARRYLYRYFSVHSQPEKAAPYATP
jgi:hypothetical protein